MNNFVKILGVIRNKICVFSLLLMTGFSITAFGQEIMSNDTAMQYFRRNGLTVGWNLGNTLDAPNGETSWGNPLASQALFDGLKAQGFNIVRIPVTWQKYIGSAPNYTISQARLERVAAVAGYANNAGLRVIINMHHDDGSWFSIKNAVSNQAQKDRITAQYGRVWTQIAEYFRNHGDWLIFESMNEVQDGGWGWSDAFKANPKAQIDIINEWNQLFTDTVRASGGNNARRYLMYPSYASGSYGILPDGRLQWGAGDVGKYFILPNDRAGSGRQIVTFHYYDPMPFAHDGQTVDWDTPSFRNEVDDLFERFKQYYIDRNIPVVIGEIGPSRSSGKFENGRNMRAEDIAQARENRVKWVEFVFSRARYYGLVPVCWDNGGYSARNAGMQFGLINRMTGQPNSEESAEVIRAMINAVR